MTITVHRFSEADIPDMHRELRNSLGHLTELGWIATSLYLPFQNHYRQILKMNDVMIFIIRVNGEFAGAVEIEDQLESWFIGYWVGLRFRRRGLATRCVQDILENDLPYKKAITARVGLKNIYSQRVLDKIGLKETRRDSEYIYYKK